jgi:predicted RNA-binding protein
MPARVVTFSELRDDWYRGAELMARLIDQSGRGEVELRGFPAQWAPIFVHFNAEWSEPVAPLAYVPMISDMSMHALLEITENAASQGRLRVLIEAVATLDPLVADVLHRLDRRPTLRIPPTTGTIPFSSWQSYGRPEVLDYAERVALGSQAKAPVAALLPCARRRPYRLSKTHRRLALGLTPLFDGGPVDEIVISSLGVIPSNFWSDPVVLVYDSGVPDIYRVLRLMRDYFGRVRYEVVVDCLEFEPYRDCLRIIHREGLVGEILTGPARRIKKLPRP